MGDEIRKTLWRNVSALMRHKYGKENLTRMAADCSIGPGTASRIKEAHTSVGIDVIERLAECFGVEPWHLLMPDLDPLHLPVALPRDEADFYRSVRKAAGSRD